MPKIEIVTHCYAGKMPQYAKFLCYQLSSLLQNRPQVDVQITICREAFESQTVKTLNYFESVFRNPRYSAAAVLDAGELTLKDMPMPAGSLFRRAIGRNMAALESDADVVWFTDVDHVFGQGCLDAAHAICLGNDINTNMVWPHSVYIHKTHDIGDARLAEFDEPEIRVIFPGNFERRTEARAWGGLQIVRGDWCRKNGYLNGTLWQEPVDTADGFKRCKCDVPFRKAVGTSISADIPNLFRMRHTRAGRDGGKKDHGEKTRETKK